MLHWIFKTSSCDSNAGVESPDAPPASGIVNSALFHSSPHGKQKPLQIVHTLHCCLADYAPDCVVNWIEGFWGHGCWADTRDECMVVGFTPLFTQHLLRHFRPSSHCAVCTAVHWEIRISLRIWHVKWWVCVSLPGWLSAPPHPVHTSACHCPVFSRCIMLIAAYLVMYSDLTLSKFLPVNEASSLHEPKFALCSIKLLQKYTILTIVFTNVIIFEH